MNPEQLLQHFDRISEAPDAITRLRRFILDLAVRGKLVEQDPNDEPANDLLKRIEMGKLTREILERDKSILDPQDFYFDIPYSWKWTELQHISVFFNGKAHEQYITKEEAFILINSSFVSNNGEKIKYSSVRLSPLEKGDIAIVMSDVPNGRALTRCFLVDNSEKYTLNQRIGGLRTDNNISKNYLSMVLDRNEYFIAYDDGKKQTNLKKIQVLSCPIPLPPITEQHRIVAKVDELMALCDQLQAAQTEREQSRDRLVAASLHSLNPPADDEAANALETQHEHARFIFNHLPRLTTRPAHIKQLRLTILNLAVRGKLVPQDPNDEPASELLTRIHAENSDLKKKGAFRAFKKAVTEEFDAGYELPATWTWEPLGNLISLMDAGWSPQCENHPRREPEMWGILKTTAVQALAFDASHHKELPAKFDPRPQYEAQVGDILITRAGPKNRVGISCVVDVVEPRLMISDKLIRFHLYSDLNPYFFALALNAGYSCQCIEDAKSGMAVMQMNISQDKLKLIPVPVIPVNEQHRIVAKVDELMALCDQLETQLNSTATDSRRLLEAVLHEALLPASEQAA